MSKKNIDGSSCYSNVTMNTADLTSVSHSNDQILKNIEAHVRMLEVSNEYCKWLEKDDHFSF